MEIWKDVVGYEGYYEVSTTGKVRGVDRVLCDGRKWKGKELSQSIKKDGHHQVCLMKDGKPKYYHVHRLMALAFIPNPDNLPMINHKDENPHNNVISNLEWCDDEYNCNYGTRNQRISATQTNDPRKSQKVEVITTSGEHIGEYPSIKEFSRALGLNYNSLKKAVIKNRPYKNYIIRRI